VLPSIPIALGVPNVDIKAIMDRQHGVAEYACSYSAKAEQPDEKVFTLVMTRKYAKLEADADFSFGGELKAVANALLDSSHVSAMQAIMAIMRVPFVQNARGDPVRLNCLPEDQVTRKLLDKRTLRTMIPLESAVDYGPHSQLGRRRVYHELVKHQWHTFGMCDITLYHLTSYYLCKRRLTPAASRAEGANSGGDVQMDEAADAHAPA